MTSTEFIRGSDLGNKFSDAVKLESRKLIAMF